MIAAELLGTSADPTPFWIDTVCLPLRRDMKKRALQEIHRVYRSAAKVVVLDPSLFQSSIESAQDALFRMRYSPWKSRLWTLQEGILAKELHVRFRNRDIRLDELTKEYEASSQSLLTTSPALQGTGNNWLNSALASFDRDIKTVFQNGNSDVDPHRIRTILRLGYLASPLYRYFREDWETENSTRVVCALLEVYSSPTTSEQPNESVVESGTLGEAIERLRQMAKIEIR